MLQIRTVTASDGEVIARLHTQSWRDSYRGILSDAYLDGDILGERQGLWRARLQSPQPGQVGLLAFNGTSAVGFAFAFPGAHERWGTLLDNLHVLPDQRGGGIGTQLLHALTGHVLAHYPGEGLFLWVYERNTRTRAYYERLGAKQIERAEITAPGGGAVAEWLYAWPDIAALHRGTRG
jgi:ribosomal protein S18 acetylase RimI-like enzyme